MSRRLIVLTILVCVVALAIVLGLLYYALSEQEHGQLPNPFVIEGQHASDGLVVSGFIEAEEIELAAELGGRIVALPFDEGDEVAAGDVLVQLDTTLLQAQRQAAEAQLAIAEGERDLLEAGVREEFIRQGEAQVAIAQAALEASRTALDDAVALRDNPQEIEVQLVEAATQVEVAQHQVNAAGVQLQMADKQVQLLETTTDQIAIAEQRYGLDLWVPFELAVAPLRYEAAVQQLNDAQAILDGAQVLLATITDLANDPQQLQAQVISAQTALETAEASLAQAQARLDALRAGPTEEQLQMADARVEEAQAALAAIQTQIERMTLYAPIDGVILQQSIHVGELAVPGIPVVTLANLNAVTLTVYVPPEQFGLVSLNQPVSVTVDSFPGREFDGTVIYISDEAEFTPRNVQTREERVNLVYAVKIRIDNADHALKPGMPADATFR